MIHRPERALELLRLGSGSPEADFRAGQQEAIRHVVEGRGRLLVVQKTGWGKSFVYFIAAKLLREAGAGPALLVSPLLALMRDQIAAAERMGLRAAAIHSDNAEDWEAVETAMARGDIDVLLIAPERLANPRFQEQVLAKLAGRLSLLVVDEAHCISDWGHDFRPHYRLLERFLRRAPADLRLLATTATASDRVTRDLAEVLGPGLSVTRGDLERPSLTLQTIRLESAAERLAWIAERMAALEGSGILYALTVRDAERLAAWLRSEGFAVEAYTSETGDRREDLERALSQNRLKALAATTALGMGYDKPDLAFVIHYQTPGSAVAYYQQVGRAGRALDSAYGVLLSGREEGEILDWFIRSAFPARREAAEVLNALEAAAPEGLTLSEMMGRIDLSGGRIQKTLALLSLESPAPVAREGYRWRATGARLDEAFWARADRLAELRRAERAQMQAYVDLPFGAHMGFLIEALDGDASGVAPPRLAPLPSAADPETIRRASAFLRRSSLPIEPRQRWPGGGLPVYGLRGAIPKALRAETGRALCVWGDAGWGREVQSGKEVEGRFSEDLVAACVEMFRDWNPQPPPVWATCVPSSLRPDLVPDFAARLAAALGLPFYDLLLRTGDRPEQKTTPNSLRRAQNLDGAFGLAGDPPPGPALLIDDLADSRWSLTLCAWILRSGGSGPVWPLVLAQGRGEG